MRWFLLFLLVIAAIYGLTALNLRFGFRKLFGG
jgi:hypothetical protein